MEDGPTHGGAIGPRLDAQLRHWMQAYIDEIGANHAARTVAVTASQDTHATRACWLRIGAFRNVCGAVLICAAVRTTSSVQAIWRKKYLLVVRAGGRAVVTSSRCNHGKSS